MPNLTIDVQGWFKSSLVGKKGGFPSGLKYKNSNKTELIMDFRVKQHDFHPGPGLFFFFRPSMQRLPVVSSAID